MHDFRAPRWLPGGHAQTIWPVFFGRRFDGSPPRFRRERWTTPDGDFVDVDFLARRATPRHRSSCSSTASKVRRAATTRKPSRAWRAARGWRYAVPHFRGCSGELNLAPRAYHSGDHEEIGWILARIVRAARRAGARGRHLAGRQRAAALGRGVRRERGGARARDRCGVVADRPRRRRPRDRPRLRPPGLHADVPAHDEAEGARQAAPASGPVRRARDCARRATCATSTRSSPRRCTAFAGADDYWTRAARQSRACADDPHSGAGAECAQRSVRAGVGAAEAGGGRSARDAVAARARRSRRLCGRTLPGHLRPFPEAIAGWLADRF